MLYQLSYLAAPRQCNHRPPRVFPCRASPIRRSRPKDGGASTGRGSTCRCFTACSRSVSKDGALAGRRVAVVVHLEAKTACLVLALRAAGAEVVAAGSNPLSTQDAVCAALVEQGVEVHARHGVSQEEFTADLLAVAESGAELVIDDGAELTRRMAEHRPELYAQLAGVSEETTTGVARLRALEQEGFFASPRSQRTTRAASTCSTTRTGRADHADRDPRAHERARRRPRVLHRRLRLGRQGRRARRSRPRWARHRRRARSRARADRAHGRLPRRRARGCAAERRRRDHGHR